MEKTKKKFNRKWVIVTLVIFLIVMGLLTFFSNTIMNYSLTKVSAQKPEYGSISTINKGSGTLQANTTVKVKAPGVREIDEITVYQYQQVYTGDVLAFLKPASDEENKELEDLKTQLETLEKAREYADRQPSDTNDYYDLEQAIRDAEQALAEANTALANARNKDSIIAQANADIATYSAQEIAWQSEVDALGTQIADLEEELEDQTDLLDPAAPDPAIQAEIDRINSELATARARLNEKASALATAVRNKTAAETRLEEAQAYLSVADAESAVTTATRNLTLARKALSDKMIIDGITDDQSADQREQEDKQMQDLRDQIAAIEETNAITQIVAPCDGVIGEININSGDTLEKDAVMMTIIEPADGYYIDVNFTTEQTSEMYVGMEVTPSMYEADRITVTQVRPDPSDPRNSRIVRMAVEGEWLYVGSTINVTLNSTNRQYDCVVPNSAIYEDDNGKFVYLMVTKSSPLGDRYIVKKKSVKVLATDGSVSALDASSVNGEYIITRSEKPLESGDQVRLEDYQQEA